MSVFRLSSESLEDFEKYLNASSLSMPTSPTNSQQSSYELQLLDAQNDENQTPASWRSLFAFTNRQHTRHLVLSVISSIGGGIPQPTCAIFYGYIFSDLAKYGAGNATGKDTLKHISTWCIALTILGVVAWVLQGASLSSWMIFGEVQAKTVRKAMFEGMLDKDIEWYDLRKDGVASLLVRIHTQTRELQLAISQPLGFLCTEIVGSCIALGIALYFSWKVTLVVVATFPVMALCLALATRSLGPAIEAQKRQLTRASKYANTAMASINTVKAFNGQEQEVWQYYETIQLAAAKYLIQARVNALQFGITKFAMISIFLQGFWFGLILVRKGLDPGNVLTAFYACLFSVQAVEIVLPQWLVLTKGMSAAHTLKSIMVQMQDGRKVTNMTGCIKPTVCIGDIEVNEVSFAYPSNPRQDTLIQANFFFPSGETTFVVGKSGSGKTTLGNLLMKYYETARGEIIVDGKSIKSLDTSWLRQNITLVQQESVLFNETVFQNIALGRRDDATREDVLEAAETADLHQTLMALPHGLDTMVGSNGKSLSGGQQQRVAIARARLRDTPILILDESTSALDYTSRTKVMEELRNWRHGKTTIIVTHDVTQIMDDDYVYVLENGSVVQEGYRKKLAEKLHGTFSTFLPTVSPPLVQEPQFVEVTDLRRKSEPLTPSLPSPDSFTFFGEENQGSNRISRIFGITDFTPTIRPSNRMSLGVGIGTAQAYDLRADEIWSTPVAPEEERFQSHVSWRSVVPLLPPKSNQQSDLPLRAYYPEIPPPVPRKNSVPGSSISPFDPQPGSGQTHRTPTLAARSTLPALDTSIRASGLFITEARSSDERKRKRKKTAASLAQILGTIWPTLTWNERIILVIGFIAAFMVAASTPAFAFVFAKLLGTFYLVHNQSAAARTWALSLLGIAIIDGISAFTTHFALEYCGQAWINYLRVEAMKRILAQPKSWFDKKRNSPDKLNESLDRNAEEMRNLIGRFAGPIFTVAWMLGISIVWACLYSWKLTFVALSCGPIMLFLTRTFDWVSSKWEHNCNQTSTITSSIFTETFSNIRVVRALTLENYFAGKHDKATLETYKTGRSRAVYSGLLYGLTYSASLFITALVFYYGTVLIIRGENDVEPIIQVVNLLLFGIGNSTAMISMVPQINSSRTTATHMLYLANLPYQNSHESQGRRRIPTPFPITFNDLSFAYSTSRATQTLKNINLTLNAGTCTALVGPSGSGKSTIISLLLGLYPPSPVPHTTYHLSHSPATVPQTPLLFPSSIFENITYGLPEGSPYAILTAAMRAAENAGIHDFIMTLEHGYNTRIGDGGMGVSGGQAQRIAIARALVRRPKLLILDEATSALDAVSAEAIRETVRKLMEKRGESEDGGIAVLIISHNVEMMRIADQVVVIEAGRIVETGSFAELRNRGGRFSKLIGLSRRDEVVAEEVRVMTPVEGRNRMTWTKGSV
ncbi:ABC transporter B family member [Lachnellula occidentalis]|uniref:ABC transporter B family member n=1 Tax=Lachnellula occidentalis TaxID=215460 RepID=A0A8H8S0E3_9HELO|nr:ABC transporter B family member [Lachnellula occidentalis]